MADYSCDEHIFALSKEIRYLRRILNSLKAVTLQPHSDRAIVVKEQEKILNTLRGNFAVKITDLEQRMKRNTIRIFGVPEASGEDTIVAVLNFIQKKLNVDLSPLDIGVCYRSGAVKPRAIVVKFVSNDIRRRVWRRRHVIDSSSLGMSEELCQERAKIWKEAVRKFGRNSVSVIEGSVIVKIADGRIERFLTLSQFYSFFNKMEF